MTHADRVREFWDKRAREEGSKVSAITNDPHLDKISTEAILEVVDGLDPRSILDIGCGNGTLMRAFLGLDRKIDIFGIDYSSKMVEVCHKAGISNVTCCDITDPSLPLPMGRYEMVVGRRVLINIEPQLRQTALRNIAGLLRPGGKYLMVENFVSGLYNTNRLRAILGLPAIKQHWHNDYLQPSDVLYAANAGLAYVSTIHFGDFYYLASRVLGAALDQSYHSPISLTSAKISSLVDTKLDYCPERIIIFSKR